ncbi:hypothetical protein Tco_0707347 [Tanacetum coccineum]|uniref:Uncharacterized protein n=1 Tax=Tanacetum coccineum TaxID=301880 RepID=A0ABQ4YBJ2_9ASTR
MGTVSDVIAGGTEGAVQQGPVRARVLNDLSAEEKERYKADIRATNILLQGIPKDIYSLINHYTDAKDIWENVKMILEGSELTKDDKESQLYDEFEHFCQNKGETIQGYYVRFTKLINDMRNIKMTMPKMQLNSKFVNNMLPEWSRFITEVKLNRVNNVDDRWMIHPGNDLGTPMWTIFLKLMKCDAFESMFRGSHFTDYDSCPNLHLKTNLHESVPSYDSNNPFEGYKIIYNFVDHMDELDVYIYDEMHEQGVQNDNNKNKADDLSSKTNFSIDSGIPHQYSWSKLVPKNSIQLKVQESRTSDSRKDNVIRHLKDLVANVNDRSREPYNAIDVTALIEQNDCDRVELEKVKQHYKELYDSIKITRAHTSEKTSTMLNEIESLKAQLRSKEPCFTSDYVKPKVLAPGMYAIDVKPIPHPLKNNRSAHLNYISHLKRVNGGFTEASGSKPKANKENRSLPAKKRIKGIEVRLRTNKSPTKIGYRNPNSPNSTVFKSGRKGHALCIWTQAVQKHMDGKSVTEEYLKIILSEKAYICFGSRYNGTDILKVSGTNCARFIDEYWKSVSDILLTKASNSKSCVGIFHQKSVPRTPQQKWRGCKTYQTLVEAARQMISILEKLSFDDPDASVQDPEPIHDDPGQLKSGLAQPKRAGRFNFNQCLMNTLNNHESMNVPSATEITARTVFAPGDNLSTNDPPRCTFDSATSSTPIYIIQLAHSSPGNVNSAELPELITHQITSKDGPKIIPLENIVGNPPSRPMDVKTAFLNGDLQEEVFVSPTVKDLEDKKNPTHVLGV